MQAKVKLMHMSSIPGYVPSGGYTDAILVSGEKVAQCYGDKDMLFNLSGEQILEEHLSDVAKSTRRVGVLDYVEIEGIYDIPDNMVVVQQTEEDICTRNMIYRTAWVVDPQQSLKELYRHRAKKYAELANAIESKGLIENNAA